MRETLLPMCKGVVEHRDKELSYWPIKDRSPRLHSVTLRWFIKRDELLVSSMLLEPMTAEIVPSAECAPTTSGAGVG